MSQRKKKAKKFQVSNLPAHLRHVNLDAAGIDIGSDRHMVDGSYCAPKDTCKEHRLGTRNETFRR